MKNNPQYGFVRIFGHYVSLDPIGGLISRIENLIYRPLNYYASQIENNRIKYPRIWKLKDKLFWCNYPHPLWAKWDRFYRVKLRIEHKLWDLGIK